MSPFFLVDIRCYTVTFEPTHTGVLEVEMVVQPLKFHKHYTTEFGRDYRDTMKIVRTDLHQARILVSQPSREAGLQKPRIVQLSSQASLSPASRPESSCPPLPLPHILVIGTPEPFA